MSAPGDLVSAPQYALAFRRLEPEPAQAQRLLVLLHGVGSDEGQLAGLGAAVATGTEVVLPRGPRTVGGERLGWYRVAFPADGPRIVAAEAEESRQRLLEFVGQLQAHHGIDRAHTVLAGFSQGGVLAASAALTAPERVAGFAMLAGRLLPEIEARLAPPAALAGLHALLVHGRDDTVLPPGLATRAAARLARLGVTHALRLHAGGHELTAAMRDAFVAWFADPGRPWNDGGRTAASAAR